MKVLFVSSGNNQLGISPIIFSQGESLKKFDIVVEYFSINGKGILGYLKNIIPLRRKISESKCDLIHAHYFFSALVPTLAFIKLPIVISFMGSDISLGYLWNITIKLCHAFLWKAVIVKSTEMKNKVGLSTASVIPNGIDLTEFKELDKFEAKKRLNLSLTKKYVLFLSDPRRQVKNYKVAENAIKRLQDNDLEFLTVYNKPHEEMVNYINSSECLLLTSKREGSPNVVKEAMACNCPIVSTVVGDVRWLLGDEPGHFMTSFEPEDVAEKIMLALEFSKNIGKTKGRERIRELGLDSDTIAKKIIGVYREVLD